MQVLEPLICSNRKSLFLDKKEKIQAKYEKKETPTDKSMYLFLINCEGKWEKGVQNKNEFMFLK